MYSIVSAIGLSGQLALGLANGASAVSPEARAIYEQTAKVADSAEQSIALFGLKSLAFSDLAVLSAESANSPDSLVHRVEPIALMQATRFVRALPDEFVLPEFAADPDGSISLDWIASRTRMFSVSIDESDRLAFAWVDGADSGHGVAIFDGQRIPRKIIQGIEALELTPSLRAA